MAAPDSLSFVSISFLSPDPRLTPCSSSFSAYSASVSSEYNSRNSPLLHRLRISTLGLAGCVIRFAASSTFASSTARRSDSINYRRSVICRCARSRSSKARSRSKPLSLSASAPAKARSAISRANPLCRSRRTASNCASCRKNKATRRSSPEIPATCACTSCGMSNVTFMRIPYHSGLKGQPRVSTPTTTVWIGYETSAAKCSPFAILPLHWPAPANRPQTEPPHQTGHNPSSRRQPRAKFPSQSAPANACCPHITSDAKNNRIANTAPHR